MTEYEHMEMNPISPARDGCFFSLSLSPALSPSRLSATLNNSLTVRADLAHQLTDKYLKRKAVRWEQSALFTSQANTPLVCVMVVVGAVGGGWMRVDEAGWAVCTVAMRTSAPSTRHWRGHKRRLWSTCPPGRRKCHLSSSPEPQMRLCSLVPLWTSSRCGRVLNHNEPAVKAIV